MSGLCLFNVIMWGISGIINLSCKEVSKYSYALTWIVLMILLVDRCFVG